MNDASACSDICFSIVLCTHNRAQLLTRAITSALSQTFQDYELIVVDDASTDKTPDLVLSYADPRLCYLRQPENRGVGAARNLGIRHARGHFIVFLDDDDTIAPNFLSEVQRVFQKAPTNVGFLLPWRQVVQLISAGEEIERFTITYGIRHERPLLRATFFRRMTGGTGGLVVRSSCFKAIGLFDEQFRAAGDTELLIRLAQQYDYLVLPKALYRVSQHSGEQLTKPSEMRAQAYEELLARHRMTLEHHPHLIRGLYRTAGANYYKVGNRTRGRKMFRTLLWNYPFQLKYWVLFGLYEVADYLPWFVRRRI